MYKLTKMEMMAITLSHPHWFTQPLPDKLVVTPGSEGAFNILWALSGKPALELLVAAKPGLWTQAYTYSRMIIEGSRLERTATVLSLGEFADYIDTRLPRFRVQGLPGIICKKTLLHGL
jgi:hypothetical protein